MSFGEPIEQLERARWHLLRYDTVSATTTAKASYVLSANALVLAGTAVLLTQLLTAVPSITGSATIVVLAGCAAVFALVGFSVVAAAQGLLALRPWRRRFGQGLPLMPFFQHNETLVLTPTFSEFSNRFKELTVEEELDAALLALWVRTKNIKQRNESVRRAILVLFIAIALLMLVIASSAVMTQF